ncbi:MAG: DUF4202 domain-containing protein [Gammaproteobacteria bacterium]|nr:MAG: DUF4202 domain-containing protein [Gammaproteobacteria bacterium]
MEDARLKKAMRLIDDANRQDPNTEAAEGRTWPRELLYAQRMSDMLNRFAPEADACQRIAIRAQHIERWKLPREAYPMDRKGYHQWRTRLYGFHAQRAGELMEQAGYDAASIERVRRAVGKKDLRHNPDTQLVEDIAALVFIEHYMEPFAEKHPEYSEEKWLTIIRRTWRKMSPKAQAFALSGGIRLPAPLVPLIQKAVAGER